MDRGRMLSLRAIRRGTFLLPQSTPPGTFMPAPLQGAQREACFPFSRLLPSVFAAPLFSSKRGHTDDLKEFVQPGFVGQVCSCAHTLRENEWHLQVPHPGCSPTLYPPTPPGSDCSRGKGLRGPLPPEVPKRGAAPRRPRKGRRGWVLRRSLDRFRKKGDRHERSRMGGGGREERQRSRTHSGMGAGGGGGCRVRARDQEQLPGRARRRRTSEAAASASGAAAAGAAAAAEVNCNLTSSCLLSPSEVGV